MLDENEPIIWSASSSPRSDVVGSDGSQAWLPAPAISSTISRKRHAMTEQQAALFGIEKLNVPRSEIPAVTHVDGSGRLQTVCEDTNPRYYRLIQAFEQLTRVPIVLNTSFNENEPVVCQPSEALDCFLRTKMDLLVMEDWMVERVETLN